jgi:competence protein ComEC
MENYKIVTSLYADTYKNITSNGTVKSKNNSILMGSYVRILDEANDLWQKVVAFGIEGWIEKINLGDSPGFKCFFVDVGQGDGALIEVGNDTEGLKILIDGGPSDNLSRYLNKWQYKYYLNKDQVVHFDYVFISHFDKDHYQGLIDIINDSHYSFGTIFHNGISKFSKVKQSYPDEYTTELGKKVTKSNQRFLITSFDTLGDFNLLKQKGGMTDLMEKFLSALNAAKSQGRLTELRRLDNSILLQPRQINNMPFEIQVLGPVTSMVNGSVAFKYFDDDSHTINGHSLVLKIKYGNKSFLFGGDLNILSEEHLLQHYGQVNPFEVDVAKSCHHGASEFTVDFMSKVNPFATVISSGDNETYSHPRADAIGCAGKYSKSKRPLVFSTELARSAVADTDRIKYGMINLRCDGKKMVLAQMKEVSTSGDVWDLYEINE